MPLSTLPATPISLCVSQILCRHFKFLLQQTSLYAGGTPTLDLFMSMRLVSGVYNQLAAPLFQKMPLKHFANGTLEMLCPQSLRFASYGPEILKGASKSQNFRILPRESC